MDGRVFVLVALRVRDGGRKHISRGTLVVGTGFEKGLSDASAGDAFEVSCCLHPMLLIRIELNTSAPSGAE